MCCSRVRWGTRHAVSLHTPLSLSCAVRNCGGQRTWCNARRRSAAARGRATASAHSQDGTGLADRPIGSRATTITRDKYNKMNRKSIIKTNMVGGALSPQGGREASFLTAARSAKKISRCKNSTAVDNYPRAFLRAWSKTKIKIGKPAISRRSFFHFWRPSNRPSPHRTAASNPARQEACESEEFAFGLWWPLRGGVGVFWLQWPPEGLPLWLPSWLSLPVYAQSSDSNASARSKPFVLSVQSSTDTVTSVSNTHFNPRLPRVNSQQDGTIGLLGV